MGAYADEQFFREQDAGDRGRTSGRNEAFEYVALNLDVDPDTLKQIGDKVNLIDYAVRLRLIAESVGSLLSSVEDTLEVLANGSVDEVASQLITNQIPPNDQNETDYWVKSFDAYRFGLADDGSVEVQTDVHGGPMFGALTFDQSLLLNAQWVEQQIQRQGVERDPEFCFFVASSITEYLTAPVEIPHG